MESLIVYILFVQLLDATTQQTNYFIPIKLIRTKNGILFSFFILFVRVLIINQGSIETK